MAPATQIDIVRADAVEDRPIRRYFDVVPSQVVVQSLDRFAARPTDQNIIAIVVRALELDSGVLDEFANLVFIDEDRLQVVQSASSALFK
jgi:hypothetical protein